MRAALVRRGGGLPSEALALEKEAFGAATANFRLAAEICRKRGGRGDFDSQSSLAAAAFLGLPEAGRVAAPNASPLKNLKNKKIKNKKMNSFAFSIVY